MVTVPAPDQCPDNPRNGPSEPGSACPCAEVSKSPDTSTAFLRQLAEGFKEKKAMNKTSDWPDPTYRRTSLTPVQTFVGAAQAGHEYSRQPSSSPGLHTSK